ncbi:MAG: 50S ribosomal protein L17 [Candidatus Marinimicrobia bacterium]|nr:50S ribosomal protein L17 [Candidatus Neomarinimicrobiota bacterium]|tara:strand:- start:600 stop:1019 length:420 start_codon:yes stop_codon:yes gene_type:complete
MRHLKKGRKLNRTRSHRKAMLSNMAASLVFYKRIRTTLPKAKTLSPFVERLITYSKNENKLHARRLIISKIIGRNSKKIANILMDEIGPQYNSRNGGYTRIIKLENRKNDNAKMCILEFVNLHISSDEMSDKKEESETK